MFTECPQGTYGPECINKCSGKCLGGVACNRTTGKCDTGCDLGYTGDMCETGLIKCRLNHVCSLLSFPSSSQFSFYITFLSLTKLKGFHLFGA